MKNNKIWLIVIGFVTMTHSLIVSAHDTTESLGAAASATDVYQIICFEENGIIPSQLFFDIKSATLSAPPLSAQVINDDLAMSTTDSIGGDAAKSPELKVARPGTNDVYTVVIDKSGASVGDVNYVIDYHCENSTGSHAGTQILNPQDQ
ncbi:MAG: hypothetical protein ACU83V_05515 [Gammaproteobacteria bacterium]